MFSLSISFGNGPEADIQLNVVVSYNTFFDIGNISSLCVNITGTR